MNFSPLGKDIIFQFVAKRQDRLLVDTTASGILIATANTSDQATKARWVKVLMIGEDVTDVKVGQYALVEPLMWTPGIMIEQEGVEQSFWRTEQKHLIAVSEEEMTDL